MFGSCVVEPQKGLLSSGWYLGENVFGANFDKFSKSLETFKPLKDCQAPKTVKPIKTDNTTLATLAPSRAMQVSRSASGSAASSLGSAGASNTDAALRTGPALLGVGALAATALALAPQAARPRPLNLRNDSRSGQRRSDKVAVCLLLF
ncbi:hypothetical protein B0H15DRAFT_799619 [Mycena belliarum]|uniref:Uncharacterized protein n=1 Tax=Mycena belliarum TaxID=1033014 RepID=A0AAD6U786_9AGAR|nr:hypothetical protein B0H15DRAFT_799619 [Mycena belliae]